MNVDKLTPRIQSGLETVKAWEDESLLQTCRAEIPFNELCPEQHRPKSSTSSSSEDSITTGGDSPYMKPDDFKYEGDDLLLKRMTLFFKRQMTWVNNPPCSVCGSKKTKCVGMRGPLSAEERDGWAGRVEEYHCPDCNSKATTFPRYNNPRKLLETKKGRCGEYANLFGLFCRAAGFEVRYISDFTDHVWVEVYSNKTSRWIMADGCEGLIDRSSMYEKGWGKKLNYILAFTTDSVTDVTRRYTRQFLSDEFQARRKVISPSGELYSDMVISQFNASLQSSNKMTPNRKTEMEIRSKQEQKFFQQTENMSWTNQETHNEGRISGSLAWKVSRGEMGDQKKKDNTSDDSDELSNSYYHVETFHHGSNDCVITVRSPDSKSQASFKDCINVSGVSCGVGIPNAISVVVIDDMHSCILQSRSFSNWNDASKFLLTVPEDKIIAIWANKTCGEDETDIERNMTRIKGFDFSHIQMPKDDTEEKDDMYVLFVGQINCLPSWAACTKCTHGTMLKACLDISNNDSQDVTFGLQCELDTTPCRILRRLPEQIMPLQTQLIASEEQKTIAFKSFIQKERDNGNVDYVGFCSKNGTAIYLFGKDEISTLRHDENSGWKTYHFLPKALLKESGDDCKEETVPHFDVPVDESFFNSLLGPSLIQGSDISIVETTTSLSKARLVGLYFSGHWCGPCRRFTPMLCEFYEHLKEVVPHHGLEIVFISSDRDTDSFTNYFATMPWLSVPFDQSRQMEISRRFGIQGIPAFIVLDTISGQVVVTKEESRSSIMSACQRGDTAIENLFQNDWMIRIPQESKDIILTLELSCEDTSDDDNDKSNAEDISSSNEENSDELALRVKEKFSQLVLNGMEPNAAAVQAISEVAEEQKNESIEKAGTVCGSSEILSINSKKESAVTQLPNDQDVLKVAKRYIENVMKKPSEYKYRSFKVSNKVFDQIASSKTGLDLAYGLGFSMYCNDLDFLCCIPLALDLEHLLHEVETRLDISKQVN